jgi:hypothetical protein
VQQSYGIADDQKDLMKFLDEEAPLIAAKEDALADIAIESGLDDELDEEEEFDDDEAPSLEDFEGYEEEGNEDR